MNINFNENIVALNEVSDFKLSKKYYTGPWSLMNIFYLKINI